MILSDKKIFEDLIKSYSKENIINIYKLYFFLNENLLLNLKDELVEKYINDVLKLKPYDLENLIMIFTKYDIDEIKEFKIFKDIKEKYTSHTIINNFNPLKKGYN